jgi:hypothetical protein
MKCTTQPDLTPSDTKLVLDNRGPFDTIGDLRHWRILWGRAKAIASTNELCTVHTDPEGNSKSSCPYPE